MKSKKDFLKVLAVSMVGMGVSLGAAHASPILDKDELSKKGYYPVFAGQDLARGTIDPFYRVQLFSVASKDLDVGHKELNRFAGFCPVLKSLSAITFTEKGSKWVRGQVLFPNGSAAHSFTKEYESSLRGAFCVPPKGTSQSDKATDTIEKIELHPWQ